MQNHIFRDRDFIRKTKTRDLTRPQINRPTGQQVNQSTGQQIDRSTGQPVNWSTRRPVNWLTGQPVNQWTRSFWVSTAVRRYTGINTKYQC